MQGTESAPTSEPLVVPGWRRPLLLVAGTTLLTLGAAMTWVRATTPAPMDIDALDDSRPSDTRFIGYMDSSPDAVDGEAGGIGQRHKGEEGSMGMPAKAKSGLYALKGPGGAVPSADDSEVWGGLSGTEIGEAYGVGGLGLVGTGRGGGGVGAVQNVAAGYGHAFVPATHNPTHRTRDDARSTFSIDVDTASYSLVRRSLRQGSGIDPASVRTEELVNYFDYGYAAPEGDVPFSVTAEVGDCPWNAERKLVHLGLQGQDIARQDVPPRNLVFLVDTSGSMSGPDRLGLVKHALRSMLEVLDSDDRVSIVVYAGSAGLVLPPTPGSDGATIEAALDRLEAGGGTNGSGGIDLAYATAQANFVEGGINRVLLLTDGDFNVGVSSHDELVAMIERKREAGVSLSVLGFGFGNLRDDTMEQLADHGNGNYAYVDSVLEARKVLVDEAAGTLVTIAKDVKLQLEFDPDQVVSHRLVGYENRVLAHADFADDTKDAGEIGSGHSVTALYEVQLRDDVTADQRLLDLAIRYKAPEGKRSRLIESTVAADVHALDDTSEAFRFSAAVAGFGQLLRGSPDVERLRYADVLQLAAGARGRDPHCYRAELLELVALAGRRAGEDLTPPATACAPSEARETNDPPAPPPAEPAPLQDLDAADDAAPSLGERARAWVVSIPDVLHVLPPLLALPFFVLAWRDRRRSLRIERK